MKKEKKMAGHDQKRNHQLIKEYIRLNIHKILNEDDGDGGGGGGGGEGLGMDGGRDGYGADFGLGGHQMAKVLGLQGVLDVAKVTAGSAYSILARTLGEAALLAQRLWYLINPYYAGMSAADVNSIIEQNQGVLDQYLGQIRGGYADAVARAEQTINSGILARDLKVATFLSNPATFIGSMAAQGIVSGAQGIARVIVPLNSFSGRQMASLGQQQQQLNAEAQQSGLEAQVNQILAEQFQQQMPQQQLLRRAQQLKQQYTELFNSEQFRNDVMSNPAVRQGQAALIEMRMLPIRRAFREMTFENLQRRFPSDFEQKNPNVFDTQEKKNAFVRYAKQQFKTTAIQQINQMLQQNPGLRTAGQRAIAEIEQLANQ
jgi:hypothetical protein